MSSSRQTLKLLHAFTSLNFPALRSPCAADSMLTNHAPPPSCRPWSALCAPSVWAASASVTRKPTTTGPTPTRQTLAALCPTGRQAHGAHDGGEFKVLSVLQAPPLSCSLSYWQCDPIRETLSLCRTACTLAASTSPRTPTTVSASGRACCRAGGRACRRRIRVEAGRDRLPGSPPNT